MGVAVNNWRTLKIEGLEDLMRHLKYIQDKPTKKALVAGIGAGMTVMKKAIRREINATNANTEHEASLKKGVRGTVASKFNRGGVDKLGRQTKMIARVGYGVGMKGGARTRVRSAGTAGPHSMGVTAANVVWAVMGTPNRRNPAGTQERPLFEDCLPKAVAAAGEMAMQKAVAKAQQVIVREAAKRK